jgi:phage protein U
MPVPMIDDIELKAVQVIRQETDQDFVRQKIAGLPGTLHQRLGRGSHRVLLSGMLMPDTATADLEKLQKKAAAGEEVTFTADIATALTIDKMVIESFRAEQQIGPAGQIAYSIVLAESPPLPPPAEVSAFGGLGDFGMGDLGFDADALGSVLDDIAAQAGSIMDLADTVMGAIDQLSALASLADLAALDDPDAPLLGKVGEVTSTADQMTTIAASIKEITG